MYKLSLRIDGDITIEAFNDAIASFQRLLREVERSVAGERATIRWTLREIHRSSPTLLTWEGTTRQRRRRRREAPKPTPDYAPVVGTTLLSGIGQLERGEGRPDKFSDDALDASSDLSRVQARRAITSLALIGENGNKEQGPNVRNVTARVAASVKDIIGPKYTAPGAVEGTLQAINAHGLLYFVIYDSIYGSRVRCDIPDRLKRDALDAFEQRVLVSGTVARDSEGHPRHVTVTDIRPLNAEVFPDDLPADPDFTDGLEIGAFLKRRWSGDG
jgi:hypothetical protein